MKNISDIWGDLVNIFVIFIVCAFILVGIKAIFGGEREGIIKTSDCRQTIQIQPDSIRTYFHKFTCRYYRTKSGVVNMAFCDHASSPWFSNSCDIDYTYSRLTGLGNCTDPKYPYLGEDDKCYPTDCTNPPNIYKWSNGLCETTPENATQVTPSVTPTNKAVISCLNLTKDEAILEVNNLPDVRDFTKRMLAAKQPIMVIPDSSKTDINGYLIWTIHVAEDHPDHLATFNWYYVNTCTGDITDFNGVTHLYKK